MIPALLLALAAVVGPLWGNHPPQWAKDLGTYARLNGGDSTLAVASADTLAHWNFEPPTVYAITVGPDSLRWTAPIRDTLGAPITSPLECIVIETRQSPFYVANRAAMLDNTSAFFTSHWAQVKAEGDTSIAAHVMTSAGAACAVALPDSGAWWVVVSRKWPGGRWSAWSNWVFK